MARPSQIAEGVTDRALAAILQAAGGEAPAVVVNPSARPRSGLIELIVAGEDPLPGTQVLSSRPARSSLATVTRSTMEQIVMRAVTENPFVHDVSFDDPSDDDSSDNDEKGLRVTLHADGGRPIQLQTGPLRERLGQLAGGRSGRLGRG